MNSANMARVMLSGLNLLSALSSHEYATMDLMNRSNDVSNQSLYDGGAGVGIMHGGYYADALETSLQQADDEQNNDEYPNYKPLGGKRKQAKESEVRHRLTPHSRSTQCITRHGHYLYMQLSSTCGYISSVILICR